MALARNEAQDENTEDIMFALKSIMSTVENMDQQMYAEQELFDCLFAPASPQYRVLIRDQLTPREGGWLTLPPLTHPY